MNFFEQQDLARRNTRKLILLLGLAVLSLITVTVLLIGGALAFFQGGTDPTLSHGSQPGFIAALGNILSWEMISGISLLIICIVFFGSLFKLAQLRSGGRGIAEAMGGRLLNVDTRDANERKILNVVEEMAIASGTPVPPVYLLEEEGINAFAAGHTPQNAVIGITRGCINLLSRDELQGVVAHEFSHIFHGDMRINLRLVALLHGILLLGLIGEYLLHSARYRSLGRSSDRDNSAAAILGVGLGLMIIGYAGTFFGNIIKSAVSRQREFLADASAVQFTRNPDGIAGALKKIGGHVYGSNLKMPNASEFSHMYFSQGIQTAFNQLMATHPPLDTRIRRIQPRWDGRYPQVTPLSATAEPATHTQSAAVSGLHAGISSANAAHVIDEAVEHIGQPATTHLDYAQQKLAALGPEIQAAAHDVFSARALVFGLFLDRHPEMRQHQWHQLQTALGESQLSSLQPQIEAATQLEPSLRLPLLELVLPTLKAMSDEQYQQFKHCLELLIQSDNKVSLLEWSLKRIVLHHLEPQATIHRNINLRELRNECQLLLSVLAYAGAKTQADAQAAFDSAVESLRFSAMTILPKADCRLAALDNALDRLNRLKPLQKPQLLKAMGRTIEQDGRITVTEAEIFRAVADALDCPVPPLIITV